MTILCKATEQYCTVVLFVLLYSVVLTFSSVDQTMYLRAQERPATLILTVTSGLRFTRARHVNNRQAQSGSLKFCSSTKNTYSWMWFMFVLLCTIVVLTFPPEEIKSVMQCDHKNAKATVNSTILWYCLFYLNSVVLTFLSVASEPLQTCDHSLEKLFEQHCYLWALICFYYDRCSSWTI